MLVGGLCLRPSQRQVVAGARQETVQPRVMQVLVALCRAEGRVLSRDDLIERCWGGIVVGDDAINRSIAKVRQLAALTTPPSFEIETVPRVGYRLIVAPPAARDAAAQPAPARPQSRPDAPASASVYASVYASAAPSAAPNADRPARGAARLNPRRSALAASAGIALLGLAAWLLRSDLRTGIAPPRLTVAVSVSDADAPGWGRGLTDELAYLAGPGKPLQFLDGPAPGAAALRLQIDTQREGALLSARAVLRGAAPGASLWAYRAPANADAQALRLQLGHVLARVIGCAASFGGTSPQPVPHLAALLTACERLDDGLAASDAEASDAWRRAAAMDPENDAVHAMAAWIGASYAQGLDDAAARPLLAEMRKLAARLRGTPAREAWYAAVEPELDGNHATIARLTALDAAVAASPDNPFLQIAHAELLAAIGQEQRALEAARRAVALEPSSAAMRGQLVLRLAAAGYGDTARSELQAAEKIWPGSVSMRDARFRFDLRYGDAAALIRAIDAGREQPNASSLWQHSLARGFLLARAEPSAANIDAVVATAQAYAHGHAVPILLQNLVQLGRVDAAYGLLDDPAQVGAFSASGGEFLFRAYMRPFWQDRRFPALAQRLGLLALWQESGAWPDLCDDAALPYECAEAARRLTGKSH